MKDDGEDAETAATDSEILEQYGCDENPLAYMIEPKGSVLVTDEDYEMKEEDLENIL